MLNLKPLQLSTNRSGLQPPREWLPCLRELINAFPQPDLATPEALCCRLVGDFASGMVLHRLLYWMSHASRPDKAVWKSDREWYAELNLAYVQMRRIRVRLAPVVTSWVEKAAGAPTYHYQLRIEALVQGIASVLGCSTVDVKIRLFDKVKNGFFQNEGEAQKSIKNLQESDDERLKIFLPFKSRFRGLTADLETQLVAHLIRLGETQTLKVLNRCSKYGNSWMYVLRALENEHVDEKAQRPHPLTPSPSQENHAAPLTITDEMREAWANSAEGRAWDARLAAAEEPAPPPKAIDQWEECWNSTYAQLEIQLDRRNFDTWLRDTHFLKYEDGTYTIGVPNSYARDMLMHRLYRNVRQILSDICGKQVEMLFEIHQAAPAPRVLSFSEQRALRSEASEAEETFYRRYQAQKGEDDVAVRNG